MASFFTDNDDLRYYVDRWIDWAPIVELVEHGFRQDGGFKSAAEAIPFYKEVLETVGAFAADEVAPRSIAIDRAGLRLVDGEVVDPKPLTDLFALIKRLELHGLCVPRELGGSNCPAMLYMLNTEILGRADVSVMAHHGFHGGMALAMLLYSVREGTTEVDPATGRILSTRFESAIREIVRGEAWGSMDITEPDAGSDMAALRTRGEQASDGGWTVTGEKIFITSGHGKYHFVIARTEPAPSKDDPLAGLKGLSLFLVPAYTEQGGRRVRHAALTRIEEKLGHHGSATCALTFDRTPAHLLGKRGDGFAQMLMMMNNARLGVGFEALGLCEAAFRLARDYAAQRPSMGKTIDRHEMIADYLDEMQTDIQVIRALCVYGGYHEELGQRMATALHVTPPGVEAARLKQKSRIHQANARRVTPLLKYLAAEKAVEMGRRCVQIHGGVGYTKEYGAEKLLRDALVMPIYEGTSQIQALMAMKDALGRVMKAPQEFVRQTAQARWRSLSARDPLERRVAKLTALSLAAQQHLLSRTAAGKLKDVSKRPMAEWRGALLGSWDPKRDFALAMLHAERLTRLMADSVSSEILLEQARRHPERREVLERALERAEPRCRFLHDEIVTTGARLLETLRGPARDEAATR